MFETSGFGVLRLLVTYGLLPVLLVVTTMFGGASRVVAESRHETKPIPMPSGLSEAKTPLSAVELEILRLTNELRSDPAGPLARHKPMPPCIDDEFYGIGVDPESGHPWPVPRLELNEIVSTELARPWAIEMDRRSEFAHQPSTTQQAVYADLGIPASAWGENIAWFSGYPPEMTAIVHFEGWRESDTGHYCSLVTARFTNVGIGEHRVGSESWAVQSFYVPNDPVPDDSVPGGQPRTSRPTGPRSTTSTR